MGAGLWVCGVAGACCGFGRLSRSLRVFLLCQEIYRLFHGVCALMIYCMWGKCCIPAILCCVLALLLGADWGGRAPHLQHHHLILTWLPHLPIPRVPSPHMVNLGLNWVQALFAGLGCCG